MEILKIEEEFIQGFRKQQRESIHSFVAGWFRNNGVEVIRQIYDDKNYRALTGYEAMQFCKEIQCKVDFDSKEQK